MDITETLFGEACLTRTWGRIGARGQAKVHLFDREEEAVRLFLDLTRQKRARGYRPRPGAVTSSDQHCPDAERSAHVCQPRALVTSTGRPGLQDVGGLKREPALSVVGRCSGRREQPADNEYRVVNTI
ncbi:WGR domain-containing protein [Neorhizobium lilium]|uniref:WGR domain-containing protein n=1 Tax=Neorhizobium lilium TaxID=2503024 RepID=UPI001FE18ABC|nr:WGR domain-containing protein [Neorhizobium lilium]